MTPMLLTMPKWLIGILVAVVLFYFAPVLINTIAEAAKNAAAGS